MFDLLESEQQACVRAILGHFVFVFIHPYPDGNGRIGRFWQTLMLRKAKACFNLVPIESAVKNHQQAYYEAIARSSKEGRSTGFIEFMLSVILEAVQGLEKLVSKKAKPQDRIAFLMKHCPREFTRKEYMQLVGDIAEHTASRDLKTAVDQGLLDMTGSRARALYKKISSNSAGRGGG